MNCTFKILFVVFFLTLIQSCKSKTEQPCDNYFIKGNNYFLAGNFDKALAEFDKGIQQDPNNAFAFYGKGQVFVMNGDYDKAIQNFNSALVSIR